MAIDLSNFNPDAFLSMPVDVPFEKRQPLPIQDYLAEIKSVAARKWASKDKTDDQGNLKAGVALDIELSLQIPEDVKTRLGYQSSTFTLKDSLMLDLNEQGGYDFSPGRNRQLREYREALDMNKPGVPFRATEMPGRLITVRLRHEDYQGTPQERVAAVAKG